MKNKLNYLALLLIVSFVTAGCKEKTTENSLVVETTQVSFSAQQNTRTVSCSAKSTIEVVSSEPVWCTAKAVERKNGSAIEIGVSKNVVTTERTATITVSDGKESAHIEVKQASGAPFFNFEFASVQQFNPQAAQRQLTVNANVPFTAKSSASWCTALVDPEATVNNLTVAVTENEGTDNRFAQVVLAATGFDNAVLNVEQRTAYVPPIEDEEDYEYGAYRIFGKAIPLMSLSPLYNRYGPIIRLSNGDIFFPTWANTCAISKDDGRTWTQYITVNTDKYTTASPVAVQTRKGTIIMGFFNGKEMSPLNWNNTTHCHDPNAKLPAYVMYSKNNGQSWSEPLKLHDEWTGMNREILETKDGHIVLSTMKMRNNPGRHCVLTYVSSDDGVTWTSSNVLDNPTSAGDHGGLMEATITQLSDDRLWMLIRTNWDYFYETFSSDNGLTWSAYQKTNIDASSSPGALRRLESGRIVLVWNRLYHKGKNTIPRKGGDSNLSDVAASWQRDEFSLMYSDDDGKTWSSPVIIAENIIPETGSSTWLTYPFVFERTKGLIWITAGYGNFKIVIRETDLPK